MAGHVRFGARTGGALIILGAVLSMLGLFFSSSVETIFRVIPSEVLGVILFLTGAQLALGSFDFSEDHGERLTTIVTAGLRSGTSAWHLSSGLRYFMLSSVDEFVFERMRSVALTLH
jgi:hypothetical protein